MAKEIAQVHIVSVLHNSTATLDAFMAGVRDQGDLVGAVTIVDNGSRDGSAELARQALAGESSAWRVLEQGNLGFAGGYAAAVSSRPDGMAVLCVNPDLRLAPGTVADLLEVLRTEPAAGIVTAPLVDLDGGLDTATRRRLPRLGGAALYSVLGSRTPARWRYNSVADAPSRSVGDLRVARVEATTGALMLLDPGFRDITTPVFDTDYWMYGEDLQLCADAAAAGLEVLVVEREPSLHLKGASSGRPRSLRSNFAFHAAMSIYVRKNLLPQRPIARGAVSAAIGARFVLNEAQNLPLKLRKRLRQRGGPRPVSTFA